MFFWSLKRWPNPSSVKSPGQKLELGFFLFQLQLHFQTLMKRAFHTATKCQVTPRLTNISKKHPTHQLFSPPVPKFFEYIWLWQFEPPSVVRQEAIPVPVTVCHTSRVPPAGIVACALHLSFLRNVSNGYWPWFDIARLLILLNFIHTTLFNTQVLKKYSCYIQYPNVFNFVTF